jgi:hypothetical protein
MPIIVGFMHNMIAHVMGDVYAKKSTFCVRCRAVLMLNIETCIENCGNALHW